MKALFIGASLLFSMPMLSAAGSKLDETMIDTLKYVFETRYAMHEAKAERYGWYLDDGIEALRHDLKESPQRASFSLFRFFKGFNDHHVGATFYSTEAAMLPFEVKECNGRYFVVWAKNDGQTHPITVGDELIDWNDEPIDQVVRQFLDEEYCFGYSNPINEELGILHLTWRSGEVGMLVPKGQVSLTFISCVTGLSYSIKLNWHYKEELVPAFPATSTTPPYAKQQKKVGSEFEFLKRRSEIPYARTHAFSYRVGSYLRDVEGSHSMGDRRGFVPLLGAPHWTSMKSDPFFAYIFRTPKGKRVGFIRIPTYSGSMSASKRFGELIRRFRFETDALVIDQQNNPGGSVFYTYALLTYLSNKPLKLCLEKFMLTDKDVYNAALLRDILSTQQGYEGARHKLEADLDGYPIGPGEAKSICAYGDFIVDQWKKGRTKSDPAYLLGISEVRPATLAYPKPILVLVNHLDFSCADIFPAILQDNRRAVIMGQRTAGAGAELEKDLYIPNRLGIKNFYIGCSDLIRDNGESLEDVGVTPDVLYDFTQEDYQNSYSHYIKAILQQLDKM